MGLWPAISQELVHPKTYGQKHTSFRDQVGWERVSTDGLKSVESSRGGPRYPENGTLSVTSAFS